MVVIARIVVKAGAGISSIYGIDISFTRKIRYTIRGEVDIGPKLTIVVYTFFIYRYEDKDIIYSTIECKIQRIISYNCWNDLILPKFGLVHLDGKS